MTHVEPFVSHTERREHVKQSFLLICHVKEHMLATLRWSISLKVWCI
jgi:hypothetical protein